MGEFKYIIQSPRSCVLAPATTELPLDTPSTVTHSRPHISDLADEILTIIFEACVESETAGYWYSAPLILLQVCRRWSNVAVSYAPLWTTIRPGYSAPSQVALWLQRSNQLQLTIQNIYQSDNGDEEPVIFSRKRDVFGLLLGEIHRWRKATLHLGDMQTTELVKKLLPGAAFSLRTLELVLHQRHDDMIQRLGQAVNTACPNLHELLLNASCCNYRVLADFPIHRIQTVSFFCALPSEDAIYLMSCCQRASTIALEDLRYDASSERTVNRFLMKKALPQLHTLSLGSNTVDAVVILMHFHLPELKDLEYTRHRCSKSRPQYPGYLTGVEFKLTRLRIFDMDLDHRGVLTVINAPPLYGAKDVDIRYSKDAIKNTLEDDYPSPWTPFPKEVVVKREARYTIFRP